MDIEIKELQEIFATHGKELRGKIPHHKQILERAFKVFLKYNPNSSLRSSCGSCADAVYYWIRNFKNE